VVAIVFVGVFAVTFVVFVVVATVVEATVVVATTGIIGIGAWYKGKSELRLICIVGSHESMPEKVAL